MQFDGKETPHWERDVIEKTLMAAYVEQRRQRRWRIFFRALIVVIIIGSLFSMWPDNKTVPALNEAHVALIDMKGGVYEDEPAGADMMATALRRAFETETAKAILIRVNSPGGSPVQGAYIYDEIIRLKGLYPEKKVYAVVTDVGASAAYYIMSAADEIYANGSSLVGSIGVLLPVMGASDVIQRLGIEQRSITAGKNKLFLDPFSPENPDHVAFAQSLVDGVHQQFIDAVKQGRGDRLKETPEIFSGLAWNGFQALELGLIDGLGSPGYVLREVIELEEVVDYTVPQGLLEKVVGQFNSSFFHHLTLSSIPKHLN